MSRTRLFVRLFGFIATAFGLTGVLLFGAAGSLRWPQAWVFLTILIALMGSGASYLAVVSPDLIERRMHVREKEAPQKVIAWLGLAAFALELILAGLDFRFDWYAASTRVVVVGDIAVIAGYVVLFLSLRENPWAARNIAIEPGQTVVSTGLYAVVRHPMYLGVMLIYGSAPLALGSYWALLPALFLLSLVIARTVNEEQVLLRDLAGYREYMDRVRWRLVPWIW